MASSSATYDAEKGGQIRDLLGRTASALETRTWENSSDDDAFGPRSLVESSGGTMPAKRVLSVSRDPVLLATRNAVLKFAGYELLTTTSDSEALLLAPRADAIILGDSVSSQEKATLIPALRSVSASPIISIYQSGHYCAGMVDALVQSIDCPEALLGALQRVLGKEKRRCNEVSFITNVAGKPGCSMTTKKPGVIWTLDVATLRFLEVNDAAAQLFGYSSNELLHMDLYDIVVPEEHERLRAHISDPSRGRAAEQWTGRRKSGSRFVMSIRFINVEIGGNDISFASASAIAPWQPEQRTRT